MHEIWYMYHLQTNKKFVGLILYDGQEVVHFEFYVKFAKFCKKANSYVPCFDELLVDSYSGPIETLSASLKDVEEQK